MKIITFIKSLKRRKSHYSLKKSKRFYLPESLNKKKLLEMFIEVHPEAKISYDSFCNIFDSFFNISFGYPRKDTCSECDKNNADIAVLTKKISEEKIDAETANSKIAMIESKQKAHLKLADGFYNLKRKESEDIKNEDVVVTMDHQKNLPLPNVSTNDVYFKRQLSFYSFSIHILGINRPLFFTYDETVSKKGSDDVTSLLDDFAWNKISLEKKNLGIYCDSCSGQNKNYTVIRYLSYIIHEKKRFEKIKVVFPVRGHSYMESDRDMALVDQSFPAELPSDWRDVLENSRKKPSPFEVFNCEREIFRKWTEFLAPKYLRTCPIATRPIKILLITSDKPYLIGYCNDFSENFEYINIKGRTLGNPTSQSSAVPVYPELSHDGPLPLKMAKVADVKELSQFCGNPEAREFYLNLKEINEPDAVAIFDEDFDDEILLSDLQKTLVKKDSNLDLSQEKKFKRKPEAKPEPKTKAKSELKRKAKPEPTAKAEPVPKKKPKPDPKKKPKPDPKKKPKPDPKKKPKPDLKTKAKPELKRKANPEPKTKAKPKTLNLRKGIQ